MKRPEDIEAELRRRLQAPLPSEYAHRRMLPPGRPLHPPDCRRYRSAAVLVPLYAADEGLGLVLIVRSATLSRHGGEVAFPGGVCEMGDGSPVETALRETEEELGWPAKVVRIVGRLSEVCIPPSRLRVRPIVGWLSALPPLRPNRAEVAEVLQVPLAHFLAREHVLRWWPPGWNRAVACFAVNGYCVWGATAMILNELLEVIAEPDGGIAVP